jgi:hypothetical protein
LVRDSSPVLLAIRGLCQRKLRDRTRALEDLVWAGKNAKLGEEVVGLIAYGLAGQTLADSGYHLADTTQRPGLLRKALAYYETALRFDAGAFRMSLLVLSWRERVRTTLGEDKKDVERAKPGELATLIFVLGMLVCLVGIVAAAVELGKANAADRAARPPAKPESHP